MSDLISRSALKKTFDEYGKKAKFTQGSCQQLIDNAPTVCGNNPKWCESCVSKGKCASTRPQTIGCFNCKHQCKEYNESPCNQCDLQYSNWKEKKNESSN